MKQRYFRHSLAIAVAAVLCVFAANDRFGRETARADQPPVSFTSIAHVAPASMTVAYAAVRPTTADASWEALIGAYWR